MRKVIIFIFWGIFLQSYAQVAPSKYVVFFSDKDNSPYDITQPEAFLTQRAIDRRAKFEIAIDETDIPIDPTYVEGVIASGAQFYIQLKWINAVIIGTDDMDVLNAIGVLPYVVGIEKIYKKSELKSVKDKFASETFSDLKSTKRDPVYGDAFNQIDMVNGISLHEAGYKGDGMVIAILDGGFLNTDMRTIFNSLFENDRILGTYNFVNPGESVYGYHSHGTLVLSVMGGYLPGIFLGTAPEASYWLLRTEDTFSEYLIEEYNWVAGAAYADSVGVDIINSSLGYSEFDNADYDHEWADLDGNTLVVTKAADLAAAKGILVVNSAGNSGDDAWKYITAPADGDSVLTVGAVYANQIITTFSSYGFDWDARVKPNIVAQGGSTVLANEYTDTVKTANGTSFSSPLIAGMMACLWQSRPNASNWELINAVEQSASQTDAPDTSYGYGIPDFGKARLYLGIEDQLSQNNNIQLVPNPVQNDFDLFWDQNKLRFDFLEITDMQGRLIKNVELSNQNGYYHMPFESFPAGIYFIRLSNTQINQSVKFIKL